MDSSGIAFLFRFLSCVLLVRWVIRGVGAEGIAVTAKSGKRRWSIGTDREGKGEKKKKKRKSLVFILRSLFLTPRSL